MSENFKAKNAGVAEIAIVENVFGDADETTAAILKNAAQDEHPRVFVVADANVVQRTDGLGSRIGRYFKANALELAAPPFIAPGGEKTKNDGFQSALALANAMTAAHPGAHDAVIALGGGATLDLAGFAAATQRCRLPLVRIPTTAIAMVDGAFANTARIDAAGVKDALATPSHACAAIVDPSFLATVIPGVWKGGISELVRHAAVRDAALMRELAGAAAELREHGAAALRDLVCGAVRSRAAKGGSDFAEWCALRLQEISSFKVPHGYAVAIAIALETTYACARGLVKEADKALICQTLADCGALDGLTHNHHILADAQAISAGFAAWRERTGSFARTLPAGIGKAKVEDEPDAEMFQNATAELFAAADAAAAK